MFKKVPTQIWAIWHLTLFTAIALSASLIKTVWLSLAIFMIGGAGIIVSPLVVIWYRENQMTPTEKEERYWNSVLSELQSIVRRIGPKAAFHRLYRLIPEHERTQTKVVVVRGPSGAGKDLACRANEVGALGWHKIVTVTTRPEIRQGEEDGVDYHFRSVEQFLADKRAGKLGEETCYVGSGHRYGIYRDDMEMARFRDLNYVILDSVGYEEMKAYYGEDNVLGVFFYATREELERRMTIRGDAPGQIAKRLANYETEIAERDHYPIVIDVTKLTPEEQSNALGTVVRAWLN